MSPVIASGRTVGYVDGDEVFGPHGHGDFRGCINGDKVLGDNRRTPKGYVDGRKVYATGLMGHGSQIGTVCGSDVQNKRSSNVCTVKGGSDQVKGAAALLLGLLD